MKTEMKSIPVPRFRGQAVEKRDNTWSWVMEISIGDLAEVIAVEHDPKKEGFKSKELAIEDLQKTAEEMCRVVSKEVYGMEPAGFYDLKRNTLVRNL